MKQHSKFMTALVAALLVSASSGAQTATHKTTAHKKTRRTAARKTRTHEHVETAAERQMRELREQVSGQQTQIDALRNQLAARDQQVAAAQQSAAEAQSQVASAASQTAAAVSQSQQNAQDVQQLKVSVGDLSTQNTTLQQTVVQNQQQVQQEINSPTALHYKGVTIQPVGFFAFEGVWRQRSVNSDINTPFNSIPFPSAVEGHTSELNFSARQSRVGLLVTGDTGPAKLTGYVETDFLGTGTSSNNNQSNSYVLRMRQFWGQAALKSGFKVTGGQMWSLVTEDRRGTDNRTEIQPQTIDPQYIVGYNWTRQPGLRLQQTWGDYNKGAFTAAVSVEQAQITNFTLNNAGNAPADYFFAGPGQNGGLYNAAAGANAGNASSATGNSAITTYANNVAPDVLLKFAYDQKVVHFEVGGIARFFRDYFYPATYVPATNTYTYGAHYQSATTTGGGVFGALRVTPSKYFETGIQLMAGPGVGRYGSAQLADVTLRPDGSLEPIKNVHGMYSLEAHLSPKFDIVSYYGGEYAHRTVYGNPSGALFGYGPVNLNDAGCYALPPAPSGSNGSGGAIASSSTNCASPTRYIQEGMLGFVYMPIKSPKYGNLRYEATYSYLQRNLWRGTVSTPVTNAPFPTPSGPRAEDSMIHVSMRYYIP
jgi:hypothetical protein